MADDGIKTKVNLRQFEQAAADRSPVGTISKENGATITRMGMDGKVQTIDANAGDKVYKDDIIKTPPNGSVNIALPDKSVITAGGNGKIDMKDWDISSDIPDAKTGSLSVISGKIAKPSPDATPFVTPAAILGVRG